MPANVKSLECLLKSSSPEYEAAYAYSLVGFTYECSPDKTDKQIEPQKILTEIYEVAGKHQSSSKINYQYLFN